MERLGDIANPRSISLIAIHSQDLPTVFSEAALEEAERAEKPTLGGPYRPARHPAGDHRRRRRPRLRRCGLGGSRSGCGGRLAYRGRHRRRGLLCQAGRPLDRDAFRRGNSAYFPDRVVPMLPEALSNDLCSLRPGKTGPACGPHVDRCAGQSDAPPVRPGADALGRPADL